MLLDLADLIAPRLNIMDAVVGMEGDGPGSGDLRKVGWLLASASPLALDAVAGGMMGLALEDNPLLLEAEARGMSAAHAEDVELVGATVEELRVPGFRLPETRATGVGFAGSAWWQRPAGALLRSAMSLRPEVVPERCIACGACVRACPEQVVALTEMRGKQAARIDQRGCIRCYCCHEMCPEDAIELRPGLLYRLAHRSGR